MSPDRDAFSVLGERLHAAAQREIAASGPLPVRRRRPTRRLAVAAVAGLLALGGAATAAELIATGRPISRNDSPARFAPGGSSRLVLRVTDPAGGLPWALRLYTSKAGLDCAIAGRLRGDRLGWMEAGAFRPRPPADAGGCQDLDRRPLLLVLDRAPEQPARTLVYGRARPGVRRIAISVGGRRYDRSTGAGGSFLLVFAGRLDNRDVRVAPAH